MNKNQRFGLVILLGVMAFLPILLSVIPARAVEVEILEATPEFVIKARFTGYSSEVHQTDDTPEIMASGRKVYAGAIACPREYPFGAKIKIGEETYICEDRMNRRFEEAEIPHFDIWFPTRSEALAFGVRYLEVEVYN